MTRVVITGLGTISPIGNSLAETWESAINGKSGIGPLTRFDCEHFSAKTAAEVKNFQLSDYMKVNERHRMDRFASYAIASSIMALEDARIQIGKDVEAERIGVWFGTAIGGIESFEESHRNLLEGGYTNLYPFATTTVISNMASSQVSIAVGARGINNCTVLSCASGANAIGESFRAIQRGEADIMIAGGSEASITPLGIGAFCAMEAISTNPDPKKACRPFDRDRDGLVMGEGAGAIILESYESAVRRHAHVYGEIISYATVGDAYHITSPAPGGEGGVRAMQLAVQYAQLEKEEIDYINAHGTSTVYNDKSETAAIKTFFKEMAYQIPISSTKSMTGHMMGAAGAIEAIFSLMAINTGTIPPTINLEHPDPECDLDYVPNHARKKRVHTVLSNAFGFGGHNTTLIFRSVKD
ncbi:beta-ketoacyl-ACP synthase II [Bacillus litorisediminis]|uniref:beta-ketoacyl-ACP synthase II n=1 Tax=Bacillus litorisediminis TaxID=2922713 RepID=UPI001FAE391A|nr:beta-ketoacyl-ACP synthase II [Bacillus litorisediminis]